MNPLKFTLKKWPVVTLVTIGLCYLTQLVAGWFGIELPDQANLDLVRKYVGWNWNFAFLCAQVLIIMPALEELLFRWLLFKLPVKGLEKHARAFACRGIVGCAIFSALLFSAAHYLFQPWPDAAFVALGFFGLAQCWLYRRTGHLWCAILNHALFNLTNLMLLIVMY